MVDYLDREETTALQNETLALFSGRVVSARDGHERASPVPSNAVLMCANWENQNAAGAKNALFIANL